MTVPGEKEVAVVEDSRLYCPLGAHCGASLLLASLRV